MLALLPLLVLALLPPLCGGAVAPCVVTTFAGSDSFACVDGLGTAARLNQPEQLSLDSFGASFFFADRANHHVRRVVFTNGSLTGNVSTIAGGPQATNPSGYVDGVGTNALFNGPTGVATDAANVTYVGDL